MQPFRHTISTRPEQRYLPMYVANCFCTHDCYCLYLYQKYITSAARQRVSPSTQHSPPSYTYPSGYVSNQGRPSPSRISFAANTVASPSTVWYSSPISQSGTPAPKVYHVSPMRSPQSGTQISHTKPHSRQRLSGEFDPTFLTQPAGHADMRLDISSLFEDQDIDTLLANLKRVRAVYVFLARPYDLRTPQVLQECIRERVQALNNVIEALGAKDVSRDLLEYKIRRCALLPGV
jgi:hypothetical protein